MESLGSQLDSLLVGTDYFQECLENLLSVLQPSYFCLDLIVRVLLEGPDGSGKRLLVKTAAKNLNMSFCEERVADLFDENIVGTEKKIRAALTKSSALAPCLIYLPGYELFCNLEDTDLDRIVHCIDETLSEILSEDDHNKQPIVLIAGTDNYNSIYTSPLFNMVQHLISIKPPSLSQATDILETIELKLKLHTEPTHTSRLSTLGDNYIGNIINSICRAEIKRHNCSTRGTADEDEENSKTEELEQTRWVDVGGLNEVKQEIIDTIQMALDFPQLRKTGLRRTGILLYGPPGTGKTLLSRAVATECGLNFINVKGPELLNEYVGQSEDNVRKLFQSARESSPSVIFFDELDSLAPNRGQAGDSAGVMDRLVSQLLAEMDGVSKVENVFIIGATNRVDLVDPSLQRPGRFDKVLEVPIASSRESRIQILKALTRKLNLALDVDIAKLESMLRANLSGADFQGLCTRALHRSFSRCVEQLELGQITEENIEVLTTMEDFLLSIEE